MNMKNITTYILSVLALLITYTAQAVETESTYYIPDALGSPIAAMDEQGSVKWRKHYKPFGEEIEQDEASEDNRVGYTGHAHDRDTGLTYMGARHYDPVIGRFMGMDPAGVNASDPRTFNRYAYANNNPYKYVDPDGRYSIVIGGIGAGLIYLSLAVLPGHEQRVDDLRQGWKALTESSSDSWEPESTWDGDYGSEVNWLPSDYFPDPGGGDNNDPNKKKKDPKRQDSKKSEHDSGARNSTEGKHEEGEARTHRDAAGGEKGDASRKQTNKGGPGGSRKRH